MDSFLVNVIMPCYNQEQYIQQAIESVLMQKTTFPFQLLISDDDSNDNTRVICSRYAENYPNKIKFISNKTNKGLLKNYKELFNLCVGKYIAILEGDDYWTDENKLQKQIDFFDINPRIGLIHSDCDLLYESGKITLDKNKDNVVNGNVTKYMLQNNFITPLTVMFKKELFDKHINIDEYIKNDFKTLDYPMFLEFSQQTNFKYQDEKFGVYRILNNSISKNIDPNKQLFFFKSTFDIQSYIIRKHNLNYDLLKNCENQYYLDCLTTYIFSRNYKKINELRKKIKPLNIKAIILAIISRFKILMSCYIKINILRQKLK